MTTDEELAALTDAYRRLRSAARAGVEAADHAEDARIYRIQLADLRRELDHEPQPHSKLSWTSPT